MKSILAFDIGGTNFRFAVVQAGQLTDIRKERSPSFVRFPNKSGKELASELVGVICSIVEEVLRRYPSLEAVAIAVPGPVTRQGVVLSAPPLWGDLVAAFPLQTVIQSRTGLRVSVFNDLCGTAFLYSELERFTAGVEFLTLITLSTGVGCKTVDLRQRRLLADSLGRGGEAGHVRVDFTDDALPCDCGERGHLSSYLSGRGIVRLIRFMMEKYPDEGQGFNLDPSDDEEAMVQAFAHAVHRRDTFAWRILNFATAKLARIIQTVSGTLGVDRYVLVGGLAFALGEDICLSLNRHLVEIGIWGWDDASLLGLVRMGVPDDNYGLLGAAKYGLVNLER